MKIKLENTIANLLLILMILFPILSQYQLKNGISLDLIILVLLNVLLFAELIICKKKIKLELFMLFLVLLIPISILSIGKYVNNSVAVNNISAMILFVVTINLFINDKLIDVNKYFNILFVLGIICTFFLLYQMVSFHMFDKIIYGKMPFLDSIDKEAFSSIEWGRATSLFYEPAHYAIFMIPLFYMAYKKNKRILSIFFAFGIIASTSTSGIVLVITFYICEIIKKRKYKTLFFLILLTLSIYMVSFDTVNKYFFDKISFDNLFSSIRLLKPLENAKYFNIDDILIGIGNNNISYYLRNSNSVLNYANAYVYSFLGFGIIGFMLFLISNIFLYKYSNKNYLFVFLILQTILLTDKLLFNRHYYYLIFMVILLKNNSKVIKESKLNHEETFICQKQKE